MYFLVDLNHHLCPLCGCLHIADIDSELHGPDCGVIRRRENEQLVDNAKFCLMGQRSTVGSFIFVSSGR